MFDKKYLQCIVVDGFIMIVYSYMIVGWMSWSMDEGNVCMYRIDYVTVDVMCWISTEREIYIRVIGSECVWEYYNAMERKAVVNCNVYDFEVE